MQSTMQDGDLTITDILRRGARVFPESQVVSFKGESSTRGSFAEVAAAGSADYPWPALAEQSAAAMCYTTGTTGAPKGVVYSHRSISLHCLAEWGAFSLKESHRALVIVPMFHVNAWGIPYTAFMLGADLLMPDRFLQP